MYYILYTLYNILFNIYYILFNMYYILHTTHNNICNKFWGPMLAPGRGANGPHLGGWGGGKDLFYVHFLRG